MAAIPWILLAAFQDGADRVRDLVQALGDDSIEVREKAADDLSSMGESARTPLEVSLRSTQSPEVRARIGEVLARIDQEKRRREYRGGAPVGGLGATLRRVRGEPGGAAVFELEIVNLGPGDHPFFGVESWNFSWPDETEGSTAAEGALEVRRRGGPEARSRTVSLDCVAEPCRTRELLGPGRSRTFQVKLDTSALGKGDFEVRAVYYAKKLLGAEENLASNALRLGTPP
jgi:hypothetical protein